MTARKRILITGGCGFIGSNFVHYYYHSHDDVVIVNLDKLTYAGNRANTQSLEGGGRYEFVQGDICDKALVARLMRGADVVIHFASETHVDRSIESAHDFVITNVSGTNTLLETARQTNLKRFIHFSTDEVYGSRAEGSFTESDPLAPSSPYSASKAASDLLALAYWKTHQVPVMIIRSTNNFGPYQFPEKVIPLFITNLIEGKKVPLYAKGENVRDWLFVDECNRATEFILERGQVGEIYNVAGGSEVSNLELTRFILSRFGKDDESIEYVPDRPAHDFRYSLDTSKLRRLGFEPTSNFSEQLQETVQWYRDHRSWWSPLKKDPYTLK